MRTQSMKNLVSTLLMVVILGAAAPAAFARPATPRGRESFVKTIRLAIQRLIGGITLNGLPSTPIPEDSASREPSGGTTNGLPSTPIPGTDSQ